MIKGVAKDKTYPFVCLEDRANPLAEQTVFHIKPKTGHDTNVALARYAAARDAGRKGQNKLDANKLSQADLEDFASVVKRIENFVFPEGNTYHEDGKVWNAITESEMIKEVGRILPAENFSEVLEASNSISSLEEGVKKSSN